jgi:hypothetical protein
MDTCAIAATAATSECFTAALVGFVILLTLVALALNGIVTGTSPNSAASKARQASAQIHHLASDGQRAMDDLSERYLREVYDQMTNNPTTTRR